MHCCFQCNSYTEKHLCMFSSHPEGSEQLNNCSFQKSLILSIEALAQSLSRTCHELLACIYSHQHIPLSLNYHNHLLLNVHYLYPPLNHSEHPQKMSYSPFEVCPSF
ncbi:Os06g0275550 [Oryza sativa Japonica Group]|uniref:Os06g0275550 protein n=1 Tax=Oryza sativa subsp. japonica TaxID=39947 RepID=A0A0P0WVL9_ORYSJ|nr:Os06g0275550 [Oryza sativa Japonica Group]